MNPIIYACWSKDFRRAFRKLLCSCFMSNSTLSYNRNRIYKAHHYYYHHNHQNHNNQQQQQQQSSNNNRYNLYYKSRVKFQNTRQDFGENNNDDTSVLNDKLVENKTSPSPSSSLSSLMVIVNKQQQQQQHGKQSTFKTDGESDVDDEDHQHCLDNVQSIKQQQQTSTFPAMITRTSMKQQQKFYLKKSNSYHQSLCDESNVQSSSLSGSSESESLIHCSNCQNQNHNHHHSSHSMPSTMTTTVEQYKQGDHDDKNNMVRGSIDQLIIDRINNKNSGDSIDNDKSLFIIIHPVDDDDNNVDDVNSRLFVVSESESSNYHHHHHQNNDRSSLSLSSKENMKKELENQNEDDDSGDDLSHSSGSYDLANDEENFSTKK